MVVAHDHRAAADDIFDEVYVPQRLFAIQRHAGDVGEQHLQRRHVVRRRQRDPVQVLVDVEVRHVLPVRCRQREAGLDHALAKAIESCQTQPVDLAHPVEVQRLLRHNPRGASAAHVSVAYQRDGGHHRQVRRTVDVIPGGIDGVHRVSAHGSLLAEMDLRFLTSGRIACRILIPSVTEFQESFHSPKAKAEQQSAIARKT